ncbi:hypothetical protein [Mariniblastus fucicola]|uniref:Thioredoxin-like fold domain-containing protein n=1 Tax=Mariniblastus fucicola TaxID=980251 RepID=A0A5B9PAC7_9BACT|nr:hypothetical protein [Mariniblastus fucicola]QEG23214.1 hypothetical protein MFFC18_31100 [Mariniblastus fucicola]
MNAGDRRDHIQQVFSLRKLPWRSFYFGQDYTIPDSVGVNSWPVYIVLDRDQNIRSISHQVDHRALEELLSSR